MQALIVPSPSTCTSYPPYSIEKVRGCSIMHAGMVPAEEFVDLCPLLELTGVPVIRKVVL